MKPGRGRGGGGRRVLTVTLHLFHLTSLFKIRNLPGSVWLHSPPSTPTSVNGQWEEGPRVFRLLLQGMVRVTRHRGLDSVCVCVCVNAGRSQGWWCGASHFYQNHGWTSGIEHPSSLHWIFVPR